MVVGRPNSARLPLFLAITVWPSTQMTPFAGTSNQPRGVHWALCELSHHHSSAVRHPVVVFEKATDTLTWFVAPATSGSSSHAVGVCVRPSEGLAARLRQSPPPPQATWRIRSRSSQKFPKSRG